MATEQEIRELKRRVSSQLLQDSRVHGVGVEKDDDGNFVLAVHVDSANAAAQRELELQLKGYPVRFIQSGPFHKQ
jgi:hypothetical protein